MMDKKRIISVLLGLLMVGGCTLAREESSLTNRHAAGKISAIKRLGESHRPVPKADLSRLIDELSSDDPAVRLYAIEALEKLTGQTRGYHYFDNPEARAQALSNWHEWLSGQQDPYDPVRVPVK